MGQLRKDWDDLNKNGMLGDWCFFESEHDGLYLALRYPDPNEAESSQALIDVYGAHSEMIHLPIGPGTGHPRWEWDGNREAPTLSPSIDVIGRWHGYFRAGKLETA